MRDAAMAAVDIRGRAGALWVCTRLGLPATGPGEAGPLRVIGGGLCVALWALLRRRELRGARRSRRCRGAEGAEWCDGRCPGYCRANSIRSKERLDDWKGRCGRSHAGCGAVSLLMLVWGSGATEFVCMCLKTAQEGLASLLVDLCLEEEPGGTAVSKKRFCWA